MNRNERDEKAAKNNAQDKNTQKNVSKKPQRGYQDQKDEQQDREKGFTAENRKQY